MKVAFANSATMPTIERLILRGGSWRKVPLKVRYGVVLHDEYGPILIDTGYTPATVSGPRSLPLRLYSMLFRTKLSPEGQIDSTLQGFGFTPMDVRYVIVTHFHADHISGLRKFPNANFLVDGGAAHEVLLSGAFKNLRHGIFKELLPSDFAERLISVNALTGYATGDILPDGFDLFGDQNVIAIPLPGHSHGHFGLYFPAIDRPFLYATDVQWLRSAILDERLPRYPAQLATADVGLARKSAECVRRFAQSGGEFVLCHDPEPTAWDL